MMFTHLLYYLLTIWYLLNTYYVPDSLLGSWNISRRKEQFLSLMSYNREGDKAAITIQW